MRLLLATISILLSAFCVQAQTVKPIRWSYSLSKNEVKQGETVEIIMKAEINSDWYLYSSDFDPNLGPTVTAVSFENNGSFKLVGALKAINPKEKYDSLWEGKIRYYIKHAEFRQKVKILKVNPVIKGLLMYQICSDKEGKCIPYEENLLFDKLKVVAMEILPEKQNVLDTPQAVVRKTVKNDPVVVEKSSEATNDRISKLELERNKLIQRDSKEKDIAVEQLKAFVQKYGGDQ